MANVNAATNYTIPLVIPTGTAVQAVLDREVRIQNVGQAVRARVAELGLGFDKLVVPIGSEVAGQIPKLEGVLVERRTLDALVADFAPPSQLFTRGRIPDNVVQRLNN